MKQKKNNKDDKESLAKEEFVALEWEGFHLSCSSTTLSFVELRKNFLEMFSEILDLKNKSNCKNKSYLG